MRHSSNRATVLFNIGKQRLTEPFAQHRVREEMLECLVRHAETTLNAASWRSLRAVNASKMGFEKVEVNLADAARYFKAHKGGREENQYYG